MPSSTTRTASGRFGRLGSRKQHASSSDSSAPPTPDSTDSSPSQSTSTRVRTPLAVRRMRSDLTDKFFKPRSETRRKPEPASGSTAPNSECTDGTAWGLHGQHNVMPPVHETTETAGACFRTITFLLCLCPAVCVSVCNCGSSLLVFGEQTKCTTCILSDQKGRYSQDYRLGDLEAVLDQAFQRSVLAFGI